MKASLLLIASLLFLASFPSLSAEPDFPLTDDSKPHDGIPKGELVKDTYTAKDGSLFPGTGREYAIYLPAGLDRSKPAPFMVFQDGVIYQAPTVFDNLIAKKEIPPLIGIFIQPGVVPAANDNALPRYNRSYEYDSVTDSYARFLIDEFLPAIKAKHGLNLSDDPNARAIAGNSSGGICAFMVAWHRPDQFRRVFSGVGTYVGIHGADQLPVLVRKYEPKPLRVFLQSGENDNNLYCGDWWLANQMMERSLTWNGYDVNHAWGKGGHDAKHATQIFPDVLRWLWKGYPGEPVKANLRGEAKWRGYEVIGDGEWEAVVTTDHRANSFLDANSKGEVLTVRRDESGYYLLICSPAGKARRISFPFTPKSQILMCATWGRENQIQLFVYGGPGNEGKTQRITLGDDGKERGRELIGERTRSGKPTVTANQTIYWSHKTVTATPPGGQTFDVLPNRVWQPSEMVISPDQTVVYCRDRAALSIGAASIDADGGWRDATEFCALQPALSLPSSFDTSTGMCVDQNGWLYCATDAGIQVCDQAGRVNFIIPIPSPQQMRKDVGVHSPSIVSDICFGGKDLSELFIACGDTIYKRPTKVHGYISGQMAPIKPPPPKL